MLTITPSTTPSRKLIVLPTGRAVREAVARACQNGDGFLPRVLNMSEFLQNGVIYEGKIAATKSARELLLWQSYIECDSKKLIGFDKEFLKFLSTSKFLFDFFSELNGEGVSLDEIDMSDTYAQFEEHLNIIRMVEGAYKRRLDAFGYYDANFEPTYCINPLFFTSYDECEFYIEGIPTNREFALFEDITAHCRVKLFFKINRFTHKLLTKLQAAGFDAPSGELGTFEACYQGKTVKKIAPQKEIPSVKLAKLSQRVAQAGFVFWQIGELVKSGVRADDICVVLPDKSFASILKSFDKSRNLNFAMGTPLTGSSYYQKLDALFLHLSEHSPQSKSKCDYLGLDAALISLDGTQNIDAKGFEELILSIPFGDSDVEEKAKEAAAELKSCFDVESLDIKTSLKLFLAILSKESIDDVGGGKVTVMEPLEARGASFEAVIVVDFNEGKVPKPQDKDLFLNSKIRSFCGLPTMFDREELQTNFYLSLFEKAKQVSISFVKNERESGSRALKWLGVCECDFDDEGAKAVLDKIAKPAEEFSPQTLVETYSIDKFSATSLFDFLTCKRKYLFKNIKRIPEHDIKTDVKPYEMGTLFHDFAKEILSPSFQGADLRGAFAAMFEVKSKSDSRAELSFMVKNTLKKLSAFFEFEQKRAQNVRIFEVEGSFSFELEGFAFNGRIDRVDIGSDGGYEIIDYKLKKNLKVDTLAKIEKKPENVTDFQLEIYLLGLASNLGVDVEVLLENNFDGAYYYDVFKPELIKEEGLAPKLELLKSVLKNIKKENLRFEDFEMCDKRSVCHHCAYAKVCDR